MLVMQVIYDLLLLYCSQESLPVGSLRLFVDFMDMLQSVTITPQVRPHPRLPGHMQCGRDLCLHLCLDPCHHIFERTLPAHIFG